MLLDPRRSSRSGLSSQASLLLALIAAGAALVLLYLLPRTGSSRAAAPGLRLPPEPEASAQDRTEPVSELAVIPQTVLVPTSDPAPATSASTVDGMGASLATEALVAAEPKVEGPKLKYERGHGKSGMIESGALRAEYRERRKERLAKEAAEAAALGTEPPKASIGIGEAPPANPNRDRLQQRGSKGGLGQEKKKKPKDG